MMPIQDYIDMLNSLIAKNSPLIINNSGLEHAKALTSAIFRNAKKINMLCGGFNSVLADSQEYRKELLFFIEKETSEINILIESHNENSETLNLVLEKKRAYPNKKISIRALSQDDVVFKNLKSNNKDMPVHFMTANDQIFRLEYNPERFTAYGAFNRPNDVQLLNNIFFEMFDKSSIIN